MVPNIFILGASGYIGGQLVVSIKERCPEYLITVLIRNQEQGRIVQKRWPDIRTVEGDLDSSAILFDEAAKSDIVFQTASCDHNASVTSLIEGLSSGRKGTYIHLSGSASIWDTSNGLGEASTRIYDDVNDIKEITSFDESHVHATTDQAVIREGIANNIKTAILLPAMVYGEGEGPLKTTSMQLPFLVEAIKQRGKAFMVGEGRNIFSTVHVKDLVNALIFLLEQALRTNGGEATWGDNGVYYVEAGECTFGEVGSEIARKMHQKGFVLTEEVDHLTPEEANKWHPYAAMMWGTNMRNHASRLRALGWKPSSSVVVDTISELLD